MSDTAFVPCFRHRNELTVKRKPYMNSQSQTFDRLLRSVETLLGGTRAPRPQKILEEGRVGKSA